MLSTIGRSKGRLLLLAGLTLALGLTVAPSGAYAQGPGAAAAAMSSPLVVQTDKGAVRGTLSGGVREFLGIPYAAPPVGALRWRAPRPAAPWAGVRDATSPGKLCAQFGSPGSGNPNTSTNEDCLYLNVDTPRTVRGRLPVMVWIHGGGFTGGAGSIYDGKVIAEQGNVIVVTINYRLGAFGFLALPSLDAESPGLSGDYGLEDQQAALRWVQRNSVAFGGNPRNVTIFGESAGGAAVCENMTSPTAAGLFQRVIAESGCLGETSGRPAAEQNGAAFAGRLGCNDAATAAACLRGKSASDVLTAGASGAWSPVVGGAVLPLPPAQALASGRYDHVPLLQGTNHDEGRLFAGLRFDASGAPLTAAHYPAVIQAQVGAANAPMVLDAYPLSSRRAAGSTATSSATRTRWTTLGCRSASRSAQRTAPSLPMSSREWCSSTRSRRSPRRSSTCRTRSSDTGPTSPPQAIRTAAAPPPARIGRGTGKGTRRSRS